MMEARVLNEIVLNIFRRFFSNFWCGFLCRVQFSGVSHVRLLFKKMWRISAFLEKKRKMRLLETRYWTPSFLLTQFWCCEWRHTTACAFTRCSAHAQQNCRCNSATAIAPTLGAIYTSYFSLIICVGHCCQWISTILVSMWLYTIITTFLRHILITNAYYVTTWLICAIIRDKFAMNNMMKASKEESSGRCQTSNKYINYNIIAI